MSPFVRPLVISMLCGMAVLGHAPAWLHVAGCEHGHPSPLVSKPSSALVACGHGCCHGDTAPRPDVAAESGEKEPDSSHESHHSDSCAICQSLAVPIGIAWQFESLSIARTDFEIAKILGEMPPESTPGSIPQPRGPPAPKA